MALDVQLNNNIEYIQQTGAVGDVSSNNAVSEPIDVTQGGVSDTNETTGSAKEVNSNGSLRSKTELYNKFNYLCQKFSFSQDEIKNIVESVSGCTEDILLNIEDSEINRIINIINKDIEI